jgi:hypothetical protein
MTRLRLPSLAAPEFGVLAVALVLACAASAVQAAPGSPASRTWANPKGFCELVSRRLPNLPKSVCVNADLAQNPGRSVKGRPFLQRDVVSPHARLKVLVLGG